MYRPEHVEQLLVGARMLGLSLEVDGVPAPAAFRRRTPCRPGGQPYEPGRTPYVRRRRRAPITGRQNRVALADDLDNGSLGGSCNILSPCYESSVMSEASRTSTKRSTATTSTQPVAGIPLHRCLVLQETTPCFALRGERPVSLVVAIAVAAIAVSAVASVVTLLLLGPGRCF